MAAIVAAAVVLVVLLAVGIGPLMSLIFAYVRRLALGVVAMAQSFFKVFLVFVVLVVPLMFLLRN